MQQPRKIVNRWITAFRKSKYLDFLDLFVVRRGHTIQEGCYLCAEVCSCHEMTKYVLGQNEGVRSGVIFNIVVGNVDVLETKREVRR